MLMQCCGLVCYLLSIYYMDFEFVYPVCVVFIVYCDSHQIHFTVNDTSCMAYTVALLLTGSLKDMMLYPRV